jgi:hypothetical protein
MSHAACVEGPCHRCSAELVVVVATSHFGCRDTGPTEKTTASNLPTLTSGMTRSSPFDLEVGGEINALPAASARDLTQADLLALAQMSASVSDAPNFARQVGIGGVPLELARKLAISGDSALVVAICDDRYRSHYPHQYIAAHHPVLVLTINGKGPEDWPNNSEDPGMGIGPFLISHEQFVPSSRVLLHTDKRRFRGE